MYTCTAERENQKTHDVTEGGEEEEDEEEKMETITSPLKKF